MNAKFEFTGKTKISFGVRLNQIRSIASFGAVAKGEVGGWIEKETNLQVSGNAWVSGDAQVSGNAWVSGDARVYGDAQVYGNARVYGDAHVYGDARVSGNASPEEIMRLDEVRAIVINSPERLRMDGWHDEKWTPEHTPKEEHECGSAHCIAGWLQALSDDPKVRTMEPEKAGMQLAPTAAASGIFFVDDDIALEWLKERKYAQARESAV